MLLFNFGFIFFSLFSVLNPKTCLNYSAFSSVRFTYNLQRVVATCTSFNIKVYNRLFVHRRYKLVYNMSEFKLLKAFFYTWLTFPLANTKTHHATNVEITVNNVHFFVIYIHNCRLYCDLCIYKIKLYSAAALLCSFYFVKAIRRGWSQNSISLYAVASKIHVKQQQQQNYRINII